MKKLNLVESLREEIMKKLHQIESLKDKKECLEIFHMKRI